MEQKQKPKYTPEQRQRRNEYFKKYYQDNKELINQMNIANHKIRAEELREYRKTMGCCHACNQEISRDCFSKHKISKKHNKNLMSFPKDPPIYTLIPSV